MSLLIFIKTLLLGGCYLKMVMILSQAILIPFYRKQMAKPVIQRPHPTELNSQCAWLLCSHGTHEIWATPGAHFSQ